jgi:hypothetical protein
VPIVIIQGWPIRRWTRCFCHCATIPAGPCSCRKWGSLETFAAQGLLAHRGSVGMLRRPVTATREHPLLGNGTGRFERAHTNPYRANRPRRLGWRFYARPWHDSGVIAVARIVLRFLADLIGLALLAIRPRRSVEVENLLLRRQLAFHLRRGASSRGASMPQLG